MAAARLFFLFPLLGLNRFQHIARLGDVREVDLWSDDLRDARCRAACVAGRPRSTLEVRANLFRLVVLDRAGVGLARGQTKLRQYVKNLLALDLHLAREIVDSNLTHPPLFKLCCPRP
jgi:hypothetical protein